MKEQSCTSKAANASISRGITDYEKYLQHRIAGIQMCVCLCAHASSLRFTCCDLADGLTDTVDFALSVGVEVPIPLETRTPYG